MGDPAWYGQGAADGARLLNDQVTRVQGLDPRFAELPAEELRAAIRSKIAQSGDELYDTVYQGSAGRIKEAYIKAWKDHLTTWQKLLTATDSDERYLRTRMGATKPSGQVAAMPEGAETGLPKPEAEE